MRERQDQWYLTKLPACEKKSSSNQSVLTASTYLSMVVSKRQQLHTKHAKAPNIFDKMKIFCGMQPKAENPKVGLFPAKLLAQQCGGCQNRGLAKPQTNSQPNTITKALIFTQFCLKVRNVKI